MQHRIVFEWQNYVTQNCEYVLMTDSQEEVFFLMKLSSRGNEIDQYECTDHISICEIIADRMDEYSVINYLDDSYYHVFKEFLAEEAKNLSGYAWDIFESAIDSYAEENSIAGTPQQESDYQSIIQNWSICKNAEVGSTEVYFNIYEGVHTVTVIIRENLGGNQSYSFSGRSWKDVYRKGFMQEVTCYLDSDEAVEGTYFSKRQLDLLNKEGRCY